MAGYYKLVIAGVLVDVDDVPNALVVGKQIASLYPKLHIGTYVRDKGDMKLLHDYSTRGLLKFMHVSAVGAISDQGELNSMTAQERAFLYSEPTVMLLTEFMQGSDGVREFAHKVGFDCPRGWGTTPGLNFATNTFFEQMMQYQPLSQAQFQQAREAVPSRHNVYLDTQQARNIAREQEQMMQYQQFREGMRDGDRASRRLSNINRFPSGYSYLEE